MPNNPLVEAIRIILRKHFGGDVALENLSSDEQLCLVRHSDGTKGVVPTASVVMMGAA
jgi:hypothetical protein